MVALLSAPVHITRIFAVRDALSRCQLGRLGVRDGGHVRKKTRYVGLSTCATRALEKADAAVAGKRLDYQAQRVWQFLSAAAERAEELHALVTQQEAETPPLTPDEAAEARAEIDAEEQNVIDFHRREVYIGFHELERLLPRDEPPAEPQLCFPAVVSLYQRPAHRPLPPLPPDLAAVLGTAACEELHTRFSDRDAWDYNDDPEAHVWWSQILPNFVDTLLAERDAARAENDAARAERARVHGPLLWLGRHQALPGLIPKKGR